MKTLYLKQQIDPSREDGKEYIVIKTINSVHYSIGQVLSEETVLNLCHNDPGIVNQHAYTVIIS